MLWLIIACLANIVYSHIIQENTTEYNDTSDEYEKMFEQDRDNFLQRKSTMEEVERDYREAQAAYRAAVNIELEQQMQDNNIDTINHCLWYEMCNTRVYIILFACFALLLCCCMGGIFLYIYYRNGRKERVYNVQTQREKQQNMTLPKQQPPMQQPSMFPPSYNYPTAGVPAVQDGSCIDNMNNSTLMWAGVAIVGVVILIFIFTL